jgi:predicted small lipoprotein YifL
MTHPVFTPLYNLPGVVILPRRLAASTLCLAVFALAACGGNAPPPVPDATMVAVLAEMHLLQAGEELTEAGAGEAQDSLLAAYGLDSTAWADAIAWYTSHPETFVGIYGRVVDTLQVQQMSEIDVKR